MTAFDELRVAAPESAINSSLAAIGIAAGYVTRPSALGTLYVAFSARGVTAVDLADSNTDFEQRYAHTHGRRALAVRRATGPIERHLDRAIETGRPGSLPLDFAGREGNAGAPGESARPAIRAATSSAATVR